MTQAFKKAYIKESSNIWSLLANIFNSFIYMLASIVLLLTFASIKQAENIFSRNFLLCLFFAFQASTNLFWIFFMGVINYPFDRIAKTDDKYFLYPRSILSSILLNNFTIFDVSIFFINYILFLVFGINDSLHFTFCIVPFLGTLALSACFIILAALIFKTRFFQNSANLIFMMTEMAQYPTAIYPLSVRIILILIPLSLVSYYPLNFIAEKNLLYSALLMLAIIIFFIISLRFFKIIAIHRRDIYD